MKRNFIILLLVITLMFCLCGCAKVVQTENAVVDAIVTDVCYESGWMQPIYTGVGFTFISHPAEYNVTMQYKSHTITVDNCDLYDAYKDNIGATVKCKLTTTHYDDGTKRTTLEWENNYD